MSSSTEPTPTPDASSAPQNPNPLLRRSNPQVTDLEQEVLDEYTQLLGNVNKVSFSLHSINFFF